MNVIIRRGVPWNRIVVKSEILLKVKNYVEEISGDMDGRDVRKQWEAIQVNLGSSVLVKLYEEHAEWFAFWVNTVGYFLCLILKVTTFSKGTTNSNVILEIKCNKYARVSNYVLTRRQARALKSQNNSCRKESSNAKCQGICQPCTLSLWDVTLLLKADDSWPSGTVLRACHVFRHGRGC